MSMLTAIGPSIIVTVAVIIEGAPLRSYCQSSGPARNCSSRSIAEFKQSILGVNFSSVVVLLLDDNLITTLDPDVFMGMQYLEMLSIIRNKLETLEAGVFDPLHNLRELHLNGNKLTNIQAGTFDNQERLLILHLNDNKIQTIEAGAFSGLTRLRQLYLQSNELKRLDPNIFPSNMYLSALYMEKNQVQCECEFKKVHEWLSTRVIMYMVKCDAPKNVSGRYIKEAFDHVIRCPKYML